MSSKNSKKNLRNSKESSSESLRASVEKPVPEQAPEKEKPVEEVVAKEVPEKPSRSSKSKKDDKESQKEPKTPPKPTKKVVEESEEEEEKEEKPKKDTKAKSKSKKAEKEVEESEEEKEEKETVKEGKKEASSSPAKRRKIPNIRLDPIPKKLKPLEEKRRRRSIDRLKMVASPAKPSKVEVAEGKGTKLKKCPNVVAQFNKRGNADALLRTIHTLLIARPNKSMNIKVNLGKFSGLVYEDEDGRANFTARVERLKVRTLRDMLAFFGQEPKGDFEDLVTRLVDFLEDPQPSEKVYRCSPKSRGLSPTPVKKLKRPLTAYNLFCKEKRAEVVEEHPDEKASEIMKILADNWKNLTEEEKEEFETAASKGKKKYQAAKKKLLLADD